MKDMHFSTNIREMKNINYELAKYVYSIRYAIRCYQSYAKQMLEITDKHEYTTNYHNFYTRQFDSKKLILP